MQVSTDSEQSLQEAEDAVKAIESSAAIRQYTFSWPDAGGNLHDVKFTQAPLGLFPAQEFMMMMTRIVKDVLDGKYDFDVMELLREREKLMAAKMPDTQNEDAVEEAIDEWMPYIKAFLKLAEIIPGFQQDIIALSLGVRRKDRMEFKERIVEAPYLGGVGAEEGVEIIKVFIRQNVRVIKRFLGKSIREIGEEVMKAIEEEKKVESNNGGAPSSTSSQPTPEST